MVVGEEILQGCSYQSSMARITSLPTCEGYMARLGLTEPAIPGRAVDHSNRCCEAWLATEAVRLRAISGGGSILREPGVRGVLT